MAFTLKVTPEELKKASSGLTTEINAIESQWKIIQSTVAKSKGYWVGEASNLQQKYLKQLEADLTMIINRLKEHPDDLLKMAGLYEAAEKTNVSTASSLAGDIIV